MSELSTGYSSFATNTTPRGRNSTKYDPSYTSSDITSIFENSARDRSCDGRMSLNDFISSPPSQTESREFSENFSRYPTSSQSGLSSHRTASANSMSRKSSSSSSTASPTRNGYNTGDNTSYGYTTGNGNTPHTKMEESSRATTKRKKPKRVQEPHPSWFTDQLPTTTSIRQYSDSHISIIPPMVTTNGQSTYTSYSNHALSALSQPYLSANSRRTATEIVPLSNQSKGFDVKSDNYSSEEEVLPSGLGPAITNDLPKMGSRLGGISSKVLPTAMAFAVGYNKWTGDVRKGHLRHSEVSYGTTTLGVDGLGGTWDNQSMNNVKGYRW